MSARKPDDNVRYEREPLWELTAQFENCVQILMKDEGDGRDKRLDKLKRGRRIAVEAEAAARRWGGPAGFTKGDYRNAMGRAFMETSLTNDAPKSSKPTDELIEAWRQPEARAFWRRVISAHDTVRRSALPGLHFSLGAMLVTGGSRATPHLLHGRDILANNKKLTDLVSELALSCEGKFKCEPQERTRTTVLRNLRPLSEGLADEARITLAEIASKYLEMGIPVGRYMAVDGSAVPAWTQQWGSDDPAVDAHLSRHSPEAGYMFHERNGVITKSWRGYNLTCLVDLTTGLTLAFDLRDATAEGEAEILRETLLPNLFQLMPNLEVTAIVGDGAYDNNPTHRVLETEYGIHLVASRRAHAFEHRGRNLDNPKLYKGPIAHISGNGQAKCRPHSKTLTYLKLDSPPRRKLDIAPGIATSTRSFRSRFECPDGCGGALSFPTELCWSNLPYYPHTPNGRPDLYAYRRALLARRNQVEATFSSLQTGYKLSLDGADRSRFRPRATKEALISIAFVTKALLALRAERTRRGELL